MDHQLRSAGSFDGRFKEAREEIAKYAFALMCVGLATFTRVELDATLGNKLPFGTYFLAVIFAAWLGGTGPAILCLACSVPAAAHFIIEPHDSLTIPDPASQIALGVFALVGIVSILLFHGIERKSSIAAESLRKVELLNQELTVANEAKDEFISLLAHELRNPLAPLQTAAELLQMSNLTPTQVNDTGRLCARHLAHMRHLVDDLFDVSRYLRGQLKLQIETVDLRQSIDEAIEFVKSQIDAKHQLLKVLVPQEPTMLAIDPLRITQAVSNLLVNASKFTPDGGRITLLVEQTDQHAHIIVKDTGQGIDPSMRELIFEPFNQVVPGRARLNGGLGLGLTLVKKLVELHSGRVSVSSSGLGRGSCFTIQLPLLTPEMTASPCVLMDDRASPGLRTESPSTNLVLIVDDNEDAASTLGTLLEIKGFTTQIRHDGVSAIAACLEFSPDTILLDIGLPGIDGYEVAKRIRHLVLPKRPCLIAVTGWGEEEHKRLSKDAGIDHHLVKPIVIDQLFPLLTASPAQSPKPVTSVPTTA